MILKVPKFKDGRPFPTRVLFGAIFFGLCFCASVVKPMKVSAEILESGGVQSPFDLGGSARALGMGGAVAAVGGQGDGFFENPAILATIQNHEILTFHSPLFADTLYDSIGYIHPIGSHNSFGAAVARIGTSDIFNTTTNPDPVGTFSSEQWQGLVGYGFRVWQGLDFGANVKYIRQDIDTLEGSGVGVDAGVLYHLAENQSDFGKIGFRNLTLGFSVSNILQPQVKLVQTNDAPARVFRPALSYLFHSGDNNVWLGVEGDLVSGGATQVKAGAEYGWNDTLFARVGFDGSNPTFGGGVKFAGFQFDYAFNQGELGSLSRFSLTYRFDKYTDPLQAQKIDLLKWVARSYAKTGDYDPAIQAWRNVLKEFPDDKEAERSLHELEQKRKEAVQAQLGEAKRDALKGDYDKALPLLAKILSLDPGNPEAKELLKQADRKMVLSTDYVRGVEAYSKEDFASAVEYLQLVYETDPHYRDVAFLYRDAQSHYMPLESMSKELTALYAKGVDFYMAGNYAQAVEAWEKVLQKSPKNFLVQRNLEDAADRLREKSGTAPQFQDSGKAP